jgi:Flp pilus assembly protein TadG
MLRRVREVQVRRAERQRDTGAVAVEFALLLPLLMLFLFGIIQYGYGLFQLQTFTSDVTDYAQDLQTGVQSCSAFASSLTAQAKTDGLDASADDVTVQWRDDHGNPVSSPQRFGYVTVTASYTPFKIGVPFIPFPDKVTRSQTVLVTDIISASPVGCLPG